MEYLKIPRIIGFFTDANIDWNYKVASGKARSCIGGEMEHGFFSLGRLILKGRKSEDFN